MTMLLLKAAAVCLYVVWVVACMVAVVNIADKAANITPGVGVTMFLIAACGPALLVAGLWWVTESVFGRAR
jgi:hypothetical protein